MKLKRGHLVIFCLLSLAVIGYANSLHNEFLHWDDYEYVKDNRAIRALNLENLKALFFRFYVGEWFPLQLLSYLIDYQVWGLNVLGYHLTNLLFHSASVLLLYLVLVNMGMGMPASFISSALFSVFPPGVEAVTWISQRKSVLNMFFMLLSALFMLKAYLSDRRKIRLFILSLCFFTASLLSKGTSIPFPVLFILYGITVAREMELKNMLKWVWRLIPFFVVSLIFLCIFLYGQKQENVARNFNIFAIYQSIFILLTAPFFWFPSRIFLPVGLNSFYPPLQFDSITDVRIILSIIFWIILIPLLARACKNKLRAFWLLSWFAGLIPGSIFAAIVLPTSEIEAASGGGDRHLYYLCLAFFGFITPGIAGLLKRQWSLAAPLLILLLASYLLLTIHRNTVWRDDLTLWSDSVKKEPDYFFQHFKLAEAYKDRYSETGASDDLDSSIMHYKKASELNPALSLAFFKLGQMQGLAGAPDSALKNLQRAQELAPHSPLPFREMAVIYSKINQPLQAIGALRKAISIDPDSFILWKEKGFMELRTGLHDDAIDSLERSLGLNPAQADAHRALGALYLKIRNDKTRALVHLRESLRLEPGQEGADVLRGAIMTLEKGRDITDER